MNHSRDLRESSSRESSEIPIFRLDNRISSLLNYPDTRISSSLNPPLLNTDREKILNKFNEISKENVVLKLLNCKHYFHSKCINEYLKSFLDMNKTPICPLCRKEITDYERVKDKEITDICSICLDNLFDGKIKLKSKSKKRRKSKKMQKSKKRKSKKRKSKKRNQFK